MYSEAVIALIRDMHVVRADGPVGVVGAVEGVAGPLVEGEN